MLRALLILGVVAAPAVADADGSGDISFELKDRGDSVEVIAHNVTAKAGVTALSPMRARLEIPLVGNPIANRLAVTDATVVQIEFDGVEQRVLSVKTKFEFGEVRQLAPFARAAQVGNDLHVMFPRKIPEVGAAVQLPEPTGAPPAVVAKPVVAPVAAAPVAPVMRSPSPAPAPATSEKPATALPKPARALPPPAEPTDFTSTMLLGLAGLAALVGGALYLRKRQAAAGPVRAIDVIAQRALGGKAKILWLAAGERELLVAVTAQQIRMLGQWPRAARPETAPLPKAQAMPDKPADRPAAAAFTAPGVGTDAGEGTRSSRPFDDVELPLTKSSPAVSGLMKLRARSPHVQPQPLVKNPRTVVADELLVDDTEADMEWAKEMLAAVKGYR